VGLYIENISYFTGELMSLEEMGIGTNLNEWESISRMGMYSSRVLDKMQKFIGFK
jgi:hypothetical protein